MKEAFWKPIANKRIRTKPRRHHTVVCPYCESKSRNINFHYRKYHPETIEKLTGDFGQITGIRFFTSTNGLE